MDGQNLRDALRPVARAVRTSNERQKDAAVFAAFDDAGGVKPEALQRSLPPLMLTWWLPGAVVAGSNVGMELTLSGAIRLQDISIRAKTTPVGAECKVRMTANGMEIESAAIQPGQTFGRSTVVSASAERAAGETLRVDIVTASGAADVTITLRYSLSGTSFSGGSSNGGTGPASGVTMVNGKTGIVILDADDIAATATRLWLTSSERAKLTATSGTNTGDQNLAPYALTSSLAGVALSGAYADLTGKPIIPTALTNLDTTVTGAQLNALKTKVDGIASGAEVNVNADWSAVSGDAQILNKPTSMAPTAHTHPVSDLTATGTRDATTILYGDNTWKTAPAGGGGGATNLTATLAPAQITVNSDTGTDAVLPVADATNAGLMLPAEKTKLTGVAAGAEVNVNPDWNAASGDAFIVNKPTLGTASAMASTAFATAAQGATADTAVQPATLTTELAKKRTYFAYPVSNTPVSTTNITGVYGTMIVITTNTLAGWIPAITTGTWDVSVTFSALVYRSVTTGGVYTAIGDGTSNTVFLGRNFPQTAGYTLTGARVFTGIAPTATIDLRYGGFSTAGTTNLVSYSAVITATRVS